MSKDDLDLEGFSDYHLALAAITIGLGCVTYYYVPFKGATPLAIGVLILAVKLFTDRRRRQREIVRRIQPSLDALARAGGGVLPPHEPYRPPALPVKDQSPGGGGHHQ